MCVLESSPLPAVSVMLARARSAKAMRDSRIYWMLAHLELRMHLCPMDGNPNNKAKPSLNFKTPEIPTLSEAIAYRAFGFGSTRLKVSLSLLESCTVAEPVWDNISVYATITASTLQALQTKNSAQAHLLRSALPTTTNPKP